MRAGAARAAHRGIVCSRAMNMPHVLSDADVESFIEQGFCTLHAAFSEEQAARARDVVWRRMEQKRGVHQSDPSTWPAVCDIEEMVDAPEIVACVTDRLAQGIPDLVGEGRWTGHRRWGFWPVNFSFGRDEPYRIPDFGWHVDGNWFTHTLECPKQGLLLIGLFSAIEPRGGGTILAGGSHRQTARVLARHPGGLDHRTLFDRVLAEPLGNFHEVTG